MYVSVNQAPIGLDNSNVVCWARAIIWTTVFENIVPKISSILSLKIPITYLHFAMHDAIIINVLRVFNLNVGNIFTRDDVIT